MLKRIFDLARPPLPEADAHITAAPPGTAERQRLRETHAVRARARQAVKEASAAVQRVQDLIGAAETANARAQATANELASAAKVWAEGGAVGEPDDGPQHAAAREAGQSAYLARRRAAGAEAGLAACTAREQQAQRALDTAESAVTNAALAVVFLERVEPLLQRLERASVEHRAAREVLAPLALLTDPRWSGIHEFAPYKFPPFVERLEDCDLKQGSGDVLIQRSRETATWSAARQWKGLVQRLCENPDASVRADAD
jgi:hypothetical protein